MEHKTKEQKFRFYHKGEWHERTETEIRKMPSQIADLQKQTTELEHMHKVASESMKHRHQIALSKYFDRLAKHMFYLGDSKIKIKYIGVLVERPYAPNFFVLAELRFNVDNTIHSLSLTQYNVTNTRQLVKQVRMRLFKSNGKQAIGCNKQMKQKFVKVATIVKDNFVETTQTNYDRCNNILRQWVAEIF